MPIRGPENNGGFCPSPTYEWNHQCCCGSGCCWDQCDSLSPPMNCLDGIPNAQWNYFGGYYAAFIPGKYKGLRFDTSLSR